MFDMVAKLCLSFYLSKQRGGVSGNIGQADETDRSAHTHVVRLHMRGQHWSAVDISPGR